MSKKVPECECCGRLISSERYVIIKIEHYDGNSVKRDSWLECERCGNAGPVRFMGKHAGG